MALFDHRRQVRVDTGGRSKVKNIGQNISNSQKNAQDAVIRRMHDADQQEGEKSDEENI